MKKKKRSQILFSCLGSTDPVRGEHDGSMLHIARHYRPEKIFWYITKEMKEHEDQDDRYNRGIAKLKEECPGYEPEILPPYYDDRDDASDFDAFYPRFEELLNRLAEENPDAEILLNLSSGTPQMKMSLALLAEDLRYRVRVIQVKNYQHRSGTSQRTTSDDYDVELELECNEDGLPGAENRCCEPDLIVVRRNKQRTQVDSLLRRYDYEALLTMGQKLPEKVQLLAEHLALRSAYDQDKAMEKAKELCKERVQELYPADNKKGPRYGEYQDLAEYILMLKLMERTQRYTDLVIRLNPLVIRLQRVWLVRQGVDFSTMGEVDWKGRERMLRAKLAQNHPDLLAYLDGEPEYRDGFRDSDLNILFCNKLIAFRGEQGTAEGQLFEALGKLNLRRNNSAHMLKNVREEDISQELGFGSGELVKRLVALLGAVYPEHFRPELFSIYDEANRYIREML